MLKDIVTSMHRHWLIKRRIDHALANLEFSTVFQPIVKIKDMKTVGFEALTRFRNNESYRAPDLWFEDAKEIGLGLNLEQAVLKEVFENLHVVPADCYVTVNVTPAFLLSRNLPIFMNDAPLNRLVIEITEQDLITDYEDVNSVLNPLRAQGVKIAVDDAGSGFSSFWHVLKLKPDLIKLDRKFVSDIDTDVGKSQFVAAIVDYSKKSGSQIIAEGVETAGELSMLSKLEVPFAQGYFLGVPREFNDIVNKF